MTSERSVVQSYDQAAAAYAAHLLHELDAKPLDRALLHSFSEEAKGPILEVGSGPGQVARFLWDQGADVRGSDLSPTMIEVARHHHPTLEFHVADFRHLPFETGSMAGMVAFYAIVHTPPEELPRVFEEWGRVLRPQGLLLLSFHIGEGKTHVDELFGEPVDLDFQFHQTASVKSALTQAGFELRAETLRAPYEGVEYPSYRAYLLARWSSASTGSAPA